MSSNKISIQIITDMGNTEKENVAYIFVEIAFAFVLCVVLHTGVCLRERNYRVRNGKTNAILGAVK